MQALDTFAILCRMALRNLRASRWKTIIVGSIIMGGAFLVVVGTSLLDSLDRSMSQSIIGSIAGHVQVYGAKSKDELTVMGSMDMEAPDLAAIDDFARTRDTLMKVPNVKAVVPMGISGAIVTSGNTIDIEMAKLRDLVRKRQEGDVTDATNTAYDAQKGHVRQIIEVLSQDIRNIKVLQNDGALAPEDEDAVKTAASDEFWNKFDANALDSLEFMENRLATLAADADMLFLRYVGTDPKVFANAFDRLRVIDGQAIPPGKRGFMFAKYTYEEQVKLKSALRLDKIKKAKTNRGALIANDDELKRFVKENSNQVKELLLQLDKIETDLFRQKLQKFLSSSENDVGKLLSAFFATTDDNFNERYDFFYKDLAPSLDLYRVRIGDTLTIKAFTKSGYVQSVNLRVYGTFEFQGLEGSPQAGELNLMDMVSFRELYGFLTDDKKQELQALKASVGAKEVGRAEAEDVLFGSAPVEEDAARTIEASATGAAEAQAALEGLSGKLQRENLADRVYDPKQLSSGVVLNAAVILKNTRPKDIDKALIDIEAATKGSDTPLKAISWQKASGIIGQFVMLMRIVLYVAVLIIFVIALVIINNAMVMATLERVQEIGTLRAVGAQKRFILGMLLVEGLITGAVFGLLGVGVGAGLVAVVGAKGIPAFNQVATFFFSGPRFYPSIATSNLVGALTIVFFVSLLSSLYPALLAMRVTPRQAMQSED
jgi:ABC-type lipoprotein release transport system permease subunit